MLLDFPSHIVKSPQVLSHLLLVVDIFPLPHPCAIRFPKSYRQISTSPISSAFSGRYFSFAVPGSYRRPSVLREPCRFPLQVTTEETHGRLGRHMAVRSPRALSLPVTGNNRGDTWPSVLREPCRCPLKVTTVEKQWENGKSYIQLQFTILLNGPGWNPWDGNRNSLWDIDARVPTHGLCEHTPNQP